MKKNIAEETANVLLEQPIIVKLAGKEYKAKRVSLATLIEVSRLISSLPDIEQFDVNSLKTTENIVEASKKGLFYAKNCEIVGLIVATLIIGYEKPKQSIFRFLSNGERKRAALALKIINGSTIEELITETQKLLNGLDAVSFFVFIASLSAINLMGEAMKTTPSGQ